ncbi:MAG TPA: patatin-like phospholipase family protein [Chthoniobacteraceae bacterium]|jgi:NTE family protein
MIFSAFALRALRGVFLPFCCFFLAWPSAGQDGAGDSPTHRPKVGLVLSGGGARGVAHVGVLKALEELRVPVDYIAGTSMGAIVGGLYASGMSPEEIERFFASANWQDLLSDSPPRTAQTFRDRERQFALNQDYQISVSSSGVQLPVGIISGQKLTANLRQLLFPVREVTDFDRLPIPFRCVATDIETGGKTVLGAGDLALAIRASMAVPAVFSPVRINDRLLVDGGVASNLPIDTVRAMGAEIVIAVDVRAELLDQSQLKSAVGIYGQMFDILIQRETLEQVKTLRGRDVYIRLPLPGATSAGFAGSVANIPPGYHGTIQHTAALRGLAVGSGRFRAFLAEQRLARDETIAVQFLKIRSKDRDLVQRLREPILMQPGETLDFARLEREVAGRRALGAFSIGDVAVVQENGKWGLQITAAERTAGPNYFNFGFDFGYSSTEESDANLLLSYRMTELNSLGAEWETRVSIGDRARLFSEFFQPVDPQRIFFVAPHLAYRGDFISGRSGAGERVRFQLHEIAVGLDAGVRLGNVGEARVGYAAGLGKVGRPVGFDEGGGYELGYAHAELTLDTLDAPAFPTTGYYASGDVRLSREELGATDDYTRFEGQIFKPISFGENTVVPRVTAGLNLSSERLPIYEQFPLGGFLSLSGLARGDLYDENAFLAELIYYRRVAKLAAGLGGALYAGFSVEAGSAWGERSEFDDVTYAGSIFLGTRTILGPLYLGVGATMEGNAAVYLELGQVFRRDKLER